MFVSFFRLSEGPKLRFRSINIEVLANRVKDLSWNEKSNLTNIYLQGRPGRPGLNGTDGKNGPKVSSYSSNFRAIQEVHSAREIENQFVED